MQDPVNASQPILRIALNIDRSPPANTPTTGAPARKASITHLRLSSFCIAKTADEPRSGSRARRDSPIRQLRLNADPAGAWGRSPHKKKQSEIQPTPPVKQTSQRRQFPLPSAQKDSQSLKNPQPPKLSDRNHRRHDRPKNINAIWLTPSISLHGSHADRPGGVPGDAQQDCIRGVLVFDEYSPQQDEETHDEANDRDGFFGYLFCDGGALPSSSTPFYEASARSAIRRDRHSMNLLIICGAPGVGKTTTLERCLAAEPANVTLFDIDWLLTPASDLAVVDIRHAADRWPAYNMLWLRVLEGVARNGTTPVLFSPLAPRDIEGIETSFDSIRWLLLDCQEATHRARLAARDWSIDSIAAMIDDGRDLRRTIRDAIATDEATPDDVARDVLRWIARNSP